MVETPEYMTALLRMTRAAGARVAAGDPEDLAPLLVLRVVVDEALAAAVAGLRRQGHSDARLAGVTGTSRQAVRARWPHTAAS